MQSAALEFRRLAPARWTVAGLMVLAGGLAQPFGFVESSVSLLLTGAAVAAYNFLQPRADRPLSVGLLLLDLFALSVFIYFSGDIENPLRSAFALPVIAAAILFSRRMAYLLAATALFLFALMIVLTFTATIPHHHLQLLENRGLHNSLYVIQESGRWTYALTHLGYLALLLAGCAYGFGTLARRIREERAGLARLLEQLPVGVAVLNPEMEVFLANSVAKEFLGDPPSAELVRNAGLADEIRKFDGSRSEFESEHDGRILRNTLARAEGKGRFVWVFRDVTHERKMTARLTQDSKMADIGLLAAGIAHEIGNPLSSLSAMLQLLELKELPEDARRKLNTMGSNVERISRIVQDITGFARPSRRKRERISLDSPVQKALQTFRYHRKSKSIRLETDLPEAELKVEVVEDQIVQTILNLLLNAADASGEGETVLLSVGQEASEVFVSVRDHGPGIPEDVRRHLFAPFFTTKDQGEGVGLGLFVCDSIVRDHGGRIDVETQPGRGTTFTVYLPRTDGESPAG